MHKEILNPDQVDLLPKVNANVNFDQMLRMPGLLDLAAMKAYALGRRSKWKDYVDIYFF